MEELSLWDAQIQDVCAAVNDVLDEAVVKGSSNWQTVTETECGFCPIAFGDRRSQLNTLTTEAGPKGPAQ